MIASTLNQLTGNPTDAETKADTLRMSAYCRHNQLLSRYCKNCSQERRRKLKRKYVRANFGIRCALCGGQHLAKFCSDTEVGLTRRKMVLAAQRIGVTGG